MEEPATACSAPDVCHQCCAERKGHLPRPAGNTSPNVAQDAVDHLCRGTLLVCVQPGVRQNLYGLIYEATFGTTGSQCVLYPFGQPVEVHLNDRPLLVPIL